jgi:hypothetical protein
MGLPRRAGWAWAWLWIWTGAAIGLAVVAYANPAGPFPALAEWDTRSAVQLFELFALLGVATLMHKLDVRQKAAGFVYFYKHHIARTSYEEKEGPLRGLLTVQSIRSALTLGMMLALLSHREALLGSIRIDAETIIGVPKVTFFALAVVGLAGSALSTLAAIQSYDYALRFTWGKEKASIKQEFVKKAHRLGVFGFYCLMWSLIASAVLAGAVSGLLAVSAVFLVMWYYYYFPPLTLETRAKRAAKEVPKSASATPVHASSLAASLGKKEGEVVTFDEQWRAARESLETLEGLLPTWAKLDVRTTKEIGDEIVRAGSGNPKAV